MVSFEVLARGFSDIQRYVPLVARFGRDQLIRTDLVVVVQITEDKRRGAYFLGTGQYVIEVVSYEVSPQVALEVLGAIQAQRISNLGGIEKRDVPTEEFTNAAQLHEGAGWSVACATVRVLAS
jgi:hypothetical protein